VGTWRLTRPQMMTARNRAQQQPTSKNESSVRATHVCTRPSRVPTQGSAASPTTPTPAQTSAQIRDLFSHIPFPPRPTKLITGQVFGAASGAATIGGWNSHHAEPGPAHLLPHDFGSLLNSHSSPPLASSSATLADSPLKHLERSE